MGPISKTFLQDSNLPIDGPSNNSDPFFPPGFKPKGSSFHSGTDICAVNPENGEQQEFSSPIAFNSQPGFQAPIQKQRSIKLPMHNSSKWPSKIQSTCIPKQPSKSKVKSNKKKEEAANWYEFVKGLETTAEKGKTNNTEIENQNSRGVTHRRTIISDEARKTWDLGKKLGLVAVSSVEETVRKISELETQETCGMKKDKVTPDVCEL